MTFPSFGDARVGGLDSTQSSASFWFDLHCLCVCERVCKHESKFVLEFVCESDDSTFSSLTLHRSAKSCPSCSSQSRLSMCCSRASTHRPKDSNHSQTYCHVVPVSQTSELFSPRFLHARTQAVSAPTSWVGFRETTLGGGLDHDWPHTFGSGNTTDVRMGLSVWPRRHWFFFCGTREKGQ